MMSIKFLFRKTSSGNLIREIDGLRFFAILFVLTAHAWGNWLPYSGTAYGNLDSSAAETIAKAVLLQGKLGVFLFFAISGFILAQPWARFYFGNGKPVKLYDFYRRRVTRLEPPYVICMVGFYILLSAQHRLSFSDDLSHLVASLFYLHNIIYDRGSTIYIAAWSLEIEFQFYILAPFIFSALFKLPPRIRRGVMIAIIVVGASTPKLLHGFPDTILFYAHFFVVGILLADLYACRVDLFSKRSLIFDFLAIAGFGLTLLIFNSEDNAYAAQFCFAAGFAMIFFAAFNSIWFRRFLRWAPICIIGGMCYSIYLIHGRVMTFTYVYVLKGFKLTGSYIVDHMILNMTIIPLTILCSMVFFVIIERPTMDSQWPRRMFNLWRRSADAPQIGQ